MTAAFLLHDQDGRTLPFDPETMSLALWSDGRFARVEIRLRDTGRMIFACGNSDACTRMNVALVAAHLAQSWSTPD